MWMHNDALYRRAAFFPRRAATAAKKLLKATGKSFIDRPQLGGLIVSQVRPQLTLNLDNNDLSRT